MLETCCFINFIESAIKPLNGFSLLLFIAREQILKVGVITEILPILILLHKLYCVFIS